MPWPQRIPLKAGQSLNPTSRELWTLLHPCPATMTYLLPKLLLSFLVIAYKHSVYLISNFNFFNPFSSWACTVVFMVLSNNRVSLSNTGTIIHTSLIPQSFCQWIKHSYYTTDVKILIHLNFITLQRIIPEFQSWKAYQWSILSYDIKKSWEEMWLRRQTFRNQEDSSSATF